MTGQTEESVCKNCFAFKAFGEGCWFRWPNKKTCTHHRKDEYSPEEYYSLEF